MRRLAVEVGAEDGEQCGMGDGEASGPSEEAGAALGRHIRQCGGGGGGLWESSQPVSRQGRNANSDYFTM